MPFSTSISEPSTSKDKKSISFGEFTLTKISLRVFASAVIFFIF